MHIEIFHEECGILLLRVNQTKFDRLLTTSLISITQKVTMKYFYLLRMCKSNTTREEATESA